MKPSSKFIFVVLSTITILPIGCHPVYAEDCKYEQDIQLTENGSILSAETHYECKESKPIVVLDPTITDVVVQKVVRPSVVSTSDYRDMMLGNNNSKGLDFFAKLIYNVN